MTIQFKDRSAAEYRTKFEAIKAKADEAAERGDEVSQRSYSTMAEGWKQMMEHARRYGRGD